MSKLFGLIFTTLLVNSIADNLKIFLLFFLQKIGFDLSKCCLLKVLPSMLRVKTVFSEVMGQGFPSGF